MPSKQVQDPAIDLLRDMLTVQLLLAGVPQRDVRTVVKCDMNRVTAIAKVLRNRKGPGA